MTEYLTAAETAKVVRKILKEQFPGIKFSVRSETYSMGSNVRVHWTDGPTTKQVDQAVGVLSGSGFDGMIDLKYGITHWMLPDGTFQIANCQGSQGSRGLDPAIHNPKPHPEAREVMFADHISPSRSHSKKFMENVIKEVSAKFGGEVPTISGTDSECWMRCQDYNQERLYWVILSNSEVKDGKLICHDHLYGEIMNPMAEAI